MDPDRPGGDWRSRVARLLEEEGPRTSQAAAVRATVIAAVVGSAAAVVLETVPRLAARYGALFAAVELAALGAFAAEYGLRLWVAPLRVGADPTPWRARLGYAASAAGLVDLLAVLPALLALLPGVGRDALRVLLLLRLLKLGRYASALALVATVVRNERRTLLAALMVMLVVLVLASAVMFALERGAQPEVFASIPHAMWWAIVTMATVGYGDMAPVTPAGRVFGGVVMILGIAMFAVPAGILATGFAQEIRRRDLVVTWQTVARVPLFAGLDAASIAEIARLLRRQLVPARYAIVRRGEPAEAMFFVVAGEVEVDLAPHPRRLGPGQYFGEIALLHDTVRTATVTAVTECELLVLDVADFRRLLDAHPGIRAALSEVARRRLAGDAAPPAAEP